MNEEPSDTWSAGRCRVPGGGCSRWPRREMTIVACGGVAEERDDVATRTRDLRGERVALTVAIEAGG